MDGSTMEQVREILLERWQRIERTSQREAVAAEELMPQSEMIEMAQCLEQIGRDTTLAAAERRELLAIERALAKMTAGAFGSCEDCDEQIPARRLLALPEARLCANCQSSEERRTARLRSPGAAVR
jgi:DnaK suppressor protein